MIEYLTCPWLMGGMAFLLGLVLGRIANRCIDEFPRHEWLSGQVRGAFRETVDRRFLRRSRSLWHYVPIFGVLSKTNPVVHEGDRWRYLAVELVNGLLLALLVVSVTPDEIVTEGGQYVLAGDVPFRVAEWQEIAPPADLSTWGWRLLLHICLVEALLIASVIDIRWMIIPDGSTLPFMVIAVVLSLLVGTLWLVPVWYEHEGLVTALSGGESLALEAGLRVPDWIRQFPHWHGLLASVIGWVIGGGVVWAVRIIGGWALGREAMGFGDVILMAMIGSVIGWQPVLVVFFLAPLCAIVTVCFLLITGKSSELPYGPWLSLAAVVLLVGWEWLWPSMGQLFLLGRYVPVMGVVCCILLAVLLRLMRLLRGDEAYWYDVPLEWTSADLTLSQSQAHPEPAPQSWEDRQTDGWPGGASGQGRVGEAGWRGTATPNSSFRPW